jgi:hypothetical protein
VNAGPVVLLGLVAGWGIGRLPWPVWSLGVGAPVLLGVVMPAGGGLATVGAILLFGYVQVYLAALTALDELWRRRTRAPTGHPERTARRRILQLKLLMATVLLAFSSPLGDPLEHTGGGVLVGSAPLPARLGAMLALAIASDVVLFGSFVAVFTRGQRMAGGVAVGVLMLACALLAVTPPAFWPTLFAGSGWLVLTTAYLWLKAARKPYWPREPREGPG